MAFHLLPDLMPAEVELAQVSHSHYRHLVHTRGPDWLYLRTTLAGATAWVVISQASTLLLLEMESPGYTRDCWRRLFRWRHR